IARCYLMEPVYPFDLRYRFGGNLELVARDELLDRLNSDLKLILMFGEELVHLVRNLRHGALQLQLTAFDHFRHRRGWITEAHFGSQILCIILLSHFWFVPGYFRGHW